MGRTALATLSRTYDTAKIQERLKKAATYIRDSAAEINDRFVEHERLHKNAQKRKAKEAVGDGNGDGDDDNEEAEYLQQARERVEKMTTAMEKSTRRVIDGYAHIHALEETLKHISSTAAAASNSATQATQSSTQRTNIDSDDHGLPSTNAPPASLTSAFQTNLQTRVDRYSSTSHHARYANHNTYINFKGVVHDAQNPGENAPVLPDRSKWFTPAEGAPALGVTITGGDGDDSDDDIAIAGQKISTKCPITFLEFKDPVTSLKCPHSYERSAIEDMIKQAAPPTARRGDQPPPGWRKTVTCPVAGCDHVLGMEDIRPDPVLVRRIKRIQRAKEAVDMEGEQDEEEGVENIDSESGDDIDAVDARGRTPARGKTPAQMARIKKEAAARRGTGRVVEDIEDDD